MDTEEIARTYENFGRHWAAGTSPLYEDWATGVARDADVLARLAALPRPKLQPTIVFASARWEGCPLEPYDRIRVWLLENWQRVVQTIRSRTVQTNEVNRC